ncbi:hypothetical protein AGENTSMITH_85 [Bacillus phage vB_BspM_AgentSmith]|nr:hypothetical protein AGENTSMITH_85 [Bacillus phage vB_BspM_AgentSmith]
MEQIAIAFTGVIAIWLSQDTRDNYRKYASIFGLAGQPFWIYSSYQSELWGILVLSVFYSYAWFKGFKNNWLKPKENI